MNLPSVSQFFSKTKAKGLKIPYENFQPFRLCFRKELRNRREVHFIMTKERKVILTDCTLCYHSCGTKVTVENGKAVKIEGLESHPLNKGKLCPKGEAALDNIYDPQRLKYPMKRVNGGWKRISWDQALTE